MSENGEIYTAGKNLTLPPAVTGVTNSTSVSINTSSKTILVKEKVKDKTKKNTSSLKLVRLILIKNCDG